MGLQMHSPFIYQLLFGITASCDVNYKNTLLRCCARMNGLFIASLQWPRCKSGYTDAIVQCNEGKTANLLES